MQAPSQQQLQQPPPSATLRVAQNLPSPDSDQESMVVLSSLSSSFAISSSASTPLHPPTPTDNDSATRLTPMVVPAKRGYKSHVPSACVNCKKAHLACDVSRPCKRCVSSGKAATCQDVQHKKRGRPKLNDTKRLNIMYGGSMIIQTPASIMQKNMPSTSISFVHEPIESFRTTHTPGSPPPQSSTTPPVPTLSPPPPPPPPLPCSPAADPTVTVFLSMEMCCARIPDEPRDLWGYDPRELMHRSLYGLISPHDTDRLARLHRLLLDNIMDVVRRHDRGFRPDARPPPAERTTSPLFQQIDCDRLTALARGSEMFVDTVHIKKQSGDYELYELRVSLGAGLGADLTKASTLDKLYIVADMKKHEYRLRAPHQLDGGAAPGNSLSPRTSRFQPPPPPPPSNASTTAAHTQLYRPLMPRTLAPRALRPTPSGPLQVRHSSVPGHFTANSHLNTVSWSTKKLDMPKVNVAPVTDKQQQQQQQQRHNGKVADRLFPSLGGSSYFRQIAAANAATTTGSQRANSATSGGVPPIHVSPGLSYRLPPGVASSSSSSSSSSGSAIPPRRVVAAVTHPTTQYFLQTSSSTLNAAASAAQRTMKQASVADGTGAAAVSKTDSNRKAEMSVRSLLC